MTPETKSVGALSMYTRSCASSFPTRIRSPNIAYAGQPHESRAGERSVVRKGLRHAEGVAHDESAEEHEKGHVGTDRWHPSPLGTNRCRAGRPRDDVTPDNEKDRQAFRPVNIEESRRTHALDSGRTPAEANGRPTTSQKGTAPTGLSRITLKAATVMSVSQAAKMIAGDQPRWPRSER